MKTYIMKDTRPPQKMTCAYTCLHPYHLLSLSQMTTTDLSSRITMHDFPMTNEEVQAELNNDPFWQPVNNAAQSGKKTTRP
jgi:hypothetical protein